MKKQVFNPYLPMGEYIPDGEPHVFGERVYIYGSHDRFGSRRYCANDYLVWSAPVDDLSNWTCHGVSYRKTDDPYNAKGKLELWAPDVVRGRDGRYYLYYCYRFLDAMGVAVSERPEGPFEFYGHVQYPDGVDFGKRDNDGTPFDPAVFVDDDGRVYLYSGFAPKGRLPIKGNLQHDGCYVMELESDMMTIKSGPSVIIPDVNHADGTQFEGHAFYEASSIRKFNGTYYFVYSSFNGHELCYATSDKPTSGWVYRGILVSNGDIGLNGRKKEDALYYTANNHGGIEYIDGEYYIFYHRHTNYSQTARQGCAENIHMDEAGRFSQVEMTSCGLNGGPLKGKGYYPAYICCNLMSRKGCFEYPFQSFAPLRKKEHPFITQDKKDGEKGAQQYITNFRDGAVAGFKYFDLRTTTSIAICYRGKANGSFEILTKLDGEPIAVIPVSPAETERTAFVPIHVPHEKSPLYIRYRGKGKTDLLGFTLD